MTSLVIKKDGRREPFDTSKVRNGIIKACEKRPISASDVEIMVNEIEANINNLMLSEIPSRRIGEMILDRLKEKDEVAYVRFASVYRDFKDVGTFLDELQKLTGNRH